MQIYLVKVNTIAPGSNMTSQKLQIWGVGILQTNLLTVPVNLTVQSCVQSWYRSQQTQKQNHLNCTSYCRSKPVSPQKKTYRKAIEACKMELGGSRVKSKFLVSTNCSQIKLALPKDFPWTKNAFDLPDQQFPANFTIPPHERESVFWLGQRGTLNALQTSVINHRYFIFRCIKVVIAASNTHSKVTIQNH